MAPAASRIFQKLQSTAHRSREDARQVAMEMCSREPKNDAEAAALLDFNARLKSDDPEWDHRFTNVMADYVLARDGALGTLTQANLDWLQARAMPSGGAPNRNLMRLLARLLKKAEQVPAGYGRQVLACLCDQMVRDGGARADMVALVDKVLARGGTPDAPWISQWEAALLLRAQDRLSACENDPAWTRLFARALGNHLLMRAHPNPDSERHALSRRCWLDPQDDHPGRYVGCLAVGLDRGAWFERLGDGDAADEARQVASLAAIRASAGKPERGHWWSKNPAPPAPDSPGQALIDFLNREAPGLLDGLIVAAR